MRRFVVVVVLAVAVTGSIPGTSGAAAPEDRQQAIAEELERLRGDLNELEAEELELAAALQVSRRRTAELDARLAELDLEIAAATAALATAEAELVAAEAHHAAVVADLVRTRAELAEARETLREQAVTAFVQGGQEPGAMVFVLEAGDVAEVQAAKALSRAVVDHQDAVVERTVALERRTARLEDEAGQAAGAAAARRSEVAADKAGLEAARAEQAAARAEAVAEAATEASLLASAQAERAAFEQRVGALEAESEAIEAELRRRAEEERQARLRAEAARGASSVRALSRGSGALAWPLANPVLTSSFGYRTHPIYGGRRLHAGVDLRASIGTPVTAARSGVVVSAGWRGAYGMAVIIDHGDGFATLSAHLSGVSVSAGQRVATGDVVGATGNTGGSTGPHLHFEVRIDGVPVDPRAHL